MRFWIKNSLSLFLGAPWKGSLKAMADAESCDNSRVRLDINGYKSIWISAKLPRTSQNPSQSPHSSGCWDTRSSWIQIPRSSWCTLCWWGKKQPAGKIHGEKSQSSWLRGALCSEGNISGSLIAFGISKTGWRNCISSARETEAKWRWNNSLPGGWRYLKKWWEQFWFF